MSSTTTPDSPRKLKILMLHGFTQSGPLFHAKTRALEKLLLKAFPASPSSPLPSYPGSVQLLYPTGPIQLRPSDIPGYTPSNPDANVSDDENTDSWAWWKGNLKEGNLVPMDKGFEVIARTIRESGPIDGVVGFSQGAAAAAMVASLLEPGRKAAFDKFEAQGGMGYPKAFLNEDGEVFHPPLKFCVIYSGFWAANVIYRGFYEPKIETPALHFIGTLDSVVDEERSKGLIEVCNNKTVVYHPGGHFVPIGKDMAAQLVGFIKSTCGPPPPKEESAEDMDVPF